MLQLVPPRAINKMSTDAARIAHTFAVHRPGNPQRCTLLRCTVEATLRGVAREADLRTPWEHKPSARLDCGGGGLQAADSWPKSPSCVCGEWWCVWGCVWATCKLQTL